MKNLQNRHIFGIKVASTLLHYWNTLLFVAVVSLVSWCFQSYIGYRAVGFIYLLAVMTVGLIGTMGPVVVAAILSVLLWDYFFIPPIYTFIIREPENIILCVVFVIVALTIGYLTARARLHEKNSREREERTNFLYEVLKDISSSRDKPEFISKALFRVSKLLDIDCGVFLSGLDGKLQFDYRESFMLPLSERAQAVAKWVFESGEVGSWPRNTGSHNEMQFLPLRGPSEMVGVFAIRHRYLRSLSLEQESLLSSFVTQLALSIERHNFEERFQETRRLQESEKLHQTILDTVSHELRTPLTAIKVSVASLSDEKSISDPKFVRTAIGHLTEASDRLNRIVGNLLDMSRINAGSLALFLEWQDIHDLIGATVRNLSRSITRHSIKVINAGEIPLIKVDIKLMEHAIANLILNAATYSPPNSEIIVAVESKNKILNISIDDLGPGIPEIFRSQIFDKFFRLPGTPTGGAGLGLSIVKGIVQSHRGEVRVESNSASGAKFIISLPIDEAAPTMREGELYE